MEMDRHALYLHLQVLVCLSGAAKVGHREVDRSATSAVAEGGAEQRMAAPFTNMGSGLIGERKVPTIHGLGHRELATGCVGDADQGQHDRHLHQHADNGGQRGARG